MLNQNYDTNPALRAVYDDTEILRRPLCGIVSGYHDLPYVMIAPMHGDAGRTAEVTGRIYVSPKFVISAGAFCESFGEVFDPDTFDSGIEGRLFSFVGTNRGRGVKIESKDFHMRHIDEPPRDRLERVSDKMMAQEDTRTGLIYGPNFRYYPVSIDKFISAIADREFRV